MNQTLDTPSEDRPLRRGAVDTPPPERYGRRGYDDGRPARGAATYVVAGILVLAVGGGGFAAGYGVAKGTGVSDAASGFGGTNGRGFMRRGGFGTVTAVTDSSVTITETGPGGNASGSTSGTSKTYAITSATTVTKDGSSASVSDIATGDTVRIQTASSTSTTATAIVIDPEMGGDPGAATQDSSGTGTDTGTSATGSTT